VNDQKHISRLNNDTREVPLLLDNNSTPGRTQEESSSYLTPRQLHTELQIGEKLCYKLIRSGAIPSTRVGNLIRIPRHRLEEALLDGSDLEAHDMRRSRKRGPVYAAKLIRTSA
jgi:excisionase family DNA binding protein